LNAQDPLQITITKTLSSFNPPLQTTATVSLQDD